MGLKNRRENKMKYHKTEVTFNKIKLNMFDPNKHLIVKTYLRNSCNLKSVVL